VFPGTSFWRFLNRTTRTFVPSDPLREAFAAHQLAAAERNGRYRRAAADSAGHGLAHMGLGHTRWKFRDDVDSKVFIEVEDSGGLLTVSRPDKDRVPLSDIPSRLLRLFLDHPGRRFTEEQLRAFIWRDVSGGNIHVHLNFREELS
jgi:DNA-binding response OmpR family regulator